MIGVLLFSMVALVAVFGTLIVISPGRPSPILGKDGRPVEGSISEKLYVEINGVPQGMFIRGWDADNPVLLFVHGGTGMPEYFLFQCYPAATEVLEEYFTVCWWERRGTGMSYSPEVPPESMTVEQIVADTVAATDYLRERFNQEKV